MPKSVKVYRRNKITHVPYQGGYYAPVYSTAHMVGTRVTVQPHPEDPKCLMVTTMAGTQPEKWHLNNELVPTKKPKAKKPAASAPVAAELTTQDALDFLEKQGYNSSVIVAGRLVRDGGLATASQVSQVIRLGGYSRDALQEIREACRVAEEKTASVLRRTLCAGDRVRWDSKYGYSISGTVVKVNRKNVSIKADDGMRWTVYPGFLTKI